jgi:hypothetical protein
LMGSMHRCARMVLFEARRSVSLRQHSVRVEGANPA